MRKGESIMNSSPWRAAELALPGGRIAIDVSGSGKFAQQTVSATRDGSTRTISNLGELAELFRDARLSVEQLAASDLVSFAYLLCVLSGRPRHVFPRDSMWPDLERCFGLPRSANEARVEAGRFVFVAYSRYMPVLTVSRITVDLSTLVIKEDVLIDSPWPLVDQVHSACTV
jgi:hypothetical protein